MAEVHSVTFWLLATSERLLRLQNLLVLLPPLNAIANLCYIKGYACLSIITDHIIMGDKNYLSLKREGSALR